MVVIRLCKTAAALEAIPERDLDLDLDALERRLVDHGWTLRVNATVMLIVKKDHEATIFQNGRVLVKTRDMPVAQAVWDELEPRLHEVANNGR